MVQEATMLKLVVNCLHNAVQHWKLWLEAQLSLDFGIAVDSSCKCFVHGGRMLRLLTSRGKARWRQSLSDCCVAVRGGEKMTGRCD
jgi:hypothetical protein